MTARTLPTAAHHQPARQSWTLWVHRGDRWGWTPKRLTWSEGRAVQAGRRLKGNPRWCVTTGMASPTEDTATGAVLGVGDKDLMLRSATAADPPETLADKAISADRVGIE